MTAPNEITVDADLYPDETATFFVKVETTVGSCSVAGGFEIAYIHGEYPGDEEKNQLRSLLQGNGEYYHPDYDHGVAFYDNYVEFYIRTFCGEEYRTKIHDPDLVILKSIRKALQEAAVELPLIYQTFVLSLLDEPLSITDQLAKLTI